MQSYETNIKEEKYEFAFGAAEIGELQPRCPVLGGRKRAGQPPESLPSLRRTRGPAVRGGGSARKGRLSRELCRNARRLPQCVGSSNPARARPSACPPLCELSSLPLDACLGWYLIITELVTVIITC